MKGLSLLVAVVCVSMAQAQLTVQSITPADNAVNVPLTTSVTVTFSAPLDTTSGFGPDQGIFWNIDSVTSYSLSQDHRSVTFGVVLTTGRVYVVGIYFARAQDGTPLDHAFGATFTTDPSFPPYSVSGSVLSGATSIPPAYSLVILSTTPVSEGKPVAVAGAIADVTGAFTIPHVANGTYYPIAAKDVNQDGGIEPGDGDGIAIGDPVTVDNGNLTGLELTFTAIPRMTFSMAWHLADSMSASLPTDKTLRAVSAWEGDTLGTASNWEFSYLHNSGQEGYRIRVGALDRAMETLDAQSFEWLSHCRPFTNPGSAADPATFIGNAENSGGRAFRGEPRGGNLHLNIRLSVGDLHWTNFGWLISDTSKNYWGAEYSVGYDSSNQWISVYSKSFLGDFATGNILVVTNVGEKASHTLPVALSLSQNYPNPFNPTTNIEFRTDHSGRASLRVFDILGREVALLADGYVEAGAHLVRWDAGNLAAGIYFCRLSTPEATRTISMLLLK